MGPLERFYKALQDGSNLMSCYLPHRDVVYTKAHLEDVFHKQFTIEEVQELLSSEGLLDK